MRAIGEPVDYKELISKFSRWSREPDEVKVTALNTLFDAVKTTKEQRLAMTHTGEETLPAYRAAVEINSSLDNADPANCGALSPAIKQTDNPALRLAAYRFLESQLTLLSSEQWLVDLCDMGVFATVFDSIKRGSEEESGMAFKLLQLFIVGRYEVTQRKFFLGEEEFNILISVGLLCPERTIAVKFSACIASLIEYNSDDELHDDKSDRVMFLRNNKDVMALLGKDQLHEGESDFSSLFSTLLKYLENHEPKEGLVDALQNAGCSWEKVLTCIVLGKDSLGSCESGELEIINEPAIFLTFKQILALYFSWMNSTTAGGEDNTILQRLGMEVFCTLVNDPGIAVRAEIDNFVGATAVIPLLLNRVTEYPIGSDLQENAIRSLINLTAYSECAREHFVKADGIALLLTLFQLEKAPTRLKEYIAWVFSYIALGVGRGARTKLLDEANVLTLCCEESTPKVNYLVSQLVRINEVEYKKQQLISTPSFMATLINSVNYAGSSFPRLSSAIEVLVQLATGEGGDADARRQAISEKLDLERFAYLCAKSDVMFHSIGLLGLMPLIHEAVRRCLSDKNGELIDAVLKAANQSSVKVCERFAYLDLFNIFLNPIEGDKFTEYQSLFYRALVKTNREISAGEKGNFILNWCVVYLKGDHDHIVNIRRIAIFFSRLAFSENSAESRLRLIKNLVFKNAEHTIVLGLSRCISSKDVPLASYAALALSRLFKGEYEDNRNLRRCFLMHEYRGLVINCHNSLRSKKSNDNLKFLILSLLSELLAGCSHTDLFLDIVSHGLFYTFLMELIQMPSSPDLLQSSALGLLSLLVDQDSASTNKCRKEFFASQESLQSVIVPYLEKKDEGFLLPVLKLLAGMAKENNLSMDARLEALLLPLMDEPHSMQVRALATAVFIDLEPPAGRQEDWIDSLVANCDEAGKDLRVASYRVLQKFMCMLPEYAGEGWRQAVSRRNLLMRLLDYWDHASGVLVGLLEGEGAEADKRRDEALLSKRFRDGLFNAMSTGEGSIQQNACKILQALFVGDNAATRVEVLIKDGVIEISAKCLRGCVNSSVRYEVIQALTALVRISFEYESGKEWRNKIKNDAGIKKRLPYCCDSDADLLLKASARTLSKDLGLSYPSVKSPGDEESKGSEDGGGWSPRVYRVSATEEPAAGGGVTAVIMGTSSMGT